MSRNVTGGAVTGDVKKCDWRCQELEMSRNVTEGAVTGGVNSCDWRCQEM